MLSIVALCDEPCAPDTREACDWLEVLREIPVLPEDSLLRAPRMLAVYRHLLDKGWLLARDDDGHPRQYCPICGDYRRGGTA